MCSEGAPLRTTPGEGDGLKHHRLNTHLNSEMQGVGHL